MMAAADELEIASRVDWHGRQPDPFFYYRSSDIFLMPSRHEGSPNALLEAMSQGLPPIVTDCLPGALEVVEHDVTGLVVPVDDPEALASPIPISVSAWGVAHANESRPMPSTRCCQSGSRSWGSMATIAAHRQVMVLARRHLTREVGNAAPWFHRIWSPRPYLLHVLARRRIASISFSPP